MHGCKRIPMPLGSCLIFCGKLIETESAGSMLDDAGGDIGYSAAECVQSGTQAPTRTIAGRYASPKIPCLINLIAAGRLAPPDHKTAGEPALGG
jgi:hypothetical protein